MRLCVRLALFLPLLFVPSAFAQFSVYGTASFSRFGFLTPTTFNGKGNSGGYVLGTTYNIPLDSRFTLGVDGRFVQGIGAKGGAGGALGLRVGFVPRRVVLRPYLQGGTGVVSLQSSQVVATGIGTYTTSTSRYTSAGSSFALGLDIRLTHSVDLRALELAYIVPYSRSSTAAAAAYLNAGVVYHFGK